MLVMRLSFWQRTAITAVVCALALGQLSPADDKTTAQQKEQQLIKVLQSNVPPQEKAIPCKQLAIYGTKAAVPALAALLPDRELASWARIALEAIPDPAADAALCRAMGQLKGELLVGVINSLGQRRSATAIGPLTARLRDADVEAASAAAVALGRIGGDRATQILQQSLASGPAAVRPAVAEGLILCAERSLAQNRRDQAVAIYDAVRKAEVPRPRVLEAIRGTILARQSAGIPLLLEQLRSPDKALFGMGLRAARELAGREVTEAVGTALTLAPPNRQVLLLLVLADRGDAAALPVVQKCVLSNNAKVRITALGILGLLGDASHVGLLLEAAQKGPDEIPAVREALLHLRGSGVNQALMAAARSGNTTVRAECLFALSARGASEALPLFLEAFKATEEPIRQAGLSALRKMAGMSEFPVLLRQLQAAESEAARRNLQELLLAVCRRSDQRAQCAQQLIAAWKTAKGSSRLVVLEILCTLDEPETLSAVQEGLQSPDLQTRKTVLRALSNWRNSKIVPQLLDLARSDGEASIKVLALRVAVPLVSRDAGLAASAKAAQFTELLKLAAAPEEKRLILAELKAAPCVESLRLAVGLLDDPALANEAALAIAELAQLRKPGIKRQELQTALQKAARARIDPDIRQRLEKQIERLGGKKS
jgi:HEAT repeat protein